MVWLVAKDEAQNCIARKRVANSFAAASDEFISTARQLIEHARPGKRVLSFAESAPPGVRPEVISVYTSPNRDGIGRQGSHVYLWGVIEQ